MSFPKLGNMVTTISDVSQYNLQWSFGPLTNLMRVFGIEINVVRQRPSIGLVFFRILGISSAMYAIIVCFIQMLSDLIFENYSQKLDNKDVNITYVLDKLKFSILLLMDLRLVMFAIINWEPLWKAAEEMEQMLRFCSSFYQRLRKISLTLVLTLLTLVSQILNMKDINSIRFDQFFSWQQKHF